MQKKALSFPWWLEGLVIIGMLVLAWVEWMHGQWIWSIIFALGGTLFGASLAARLVMGGRDGE